MTEKQLNQIEAVFRMVDREIWIVTAASDQSRGGLVATWVSQASIDCESPTVVIGIAPNHFTSKLIDASHAFALHLINSDQIEHVWNFAIGSGRDRDKFENVAMRVGETSSPLLEECLARLECQVFHTERTGDRIYYWADVVTGETVSEGDALTESRLFALASDQQKQDLRDGRDADIAVQRSLQEAWRKTLSK